MASAGPISVSPGGRYFLDGSGDPFFWLGDTQWELVRLPPLDDVAAILEDRRSRGFSVLQVMLTGVGDGTGANVSGHTPWRDSGPLVPNERYFAHVDAALELCRSSGLIVALGLYHQLHDARVTPASARQWARWVAQRCGDMPNLVWAMYPRAEQGFVPVVRELAAGLKEGDGGAHPITVHPDPSPATSSLLFNEPWMAFHSIQTWADTDLIAPMVAHDYRLEPAKPVVMAEGAYEAGEEYGFEVTPLWVRRQAYWSYLAGGHHSYGHNDLWRLPSRWREALDAPGAAHLAILRHVLTSLSEWWSLVPDPSLIVGCEACDPAMNTAARHVSGRWGLVYMGEGGGVSVALSALRAGSGIIAKWVDPTTGDTEPAGSFEVSDTVRLCAPPAWEDALLVLEAG